MITDSEKLDKILESLTKLEKLHKIFPELERIQKKLKISIGTNRETTITNYDSSVRSYEKFAIEKLELQKITIQNHKSSILGYLNHSKGIITRETVRAYHDSNESESWKTNQVKALRRYLRDFLKLGPWIEEFGFSTSTNKLKQEIPTNEELVRFCLALDDFQIQLIFLILLNSGLREGEILSLNYKSIDFETNQIDSREAHSGKTKLSWFSFVTQQTADCLNAWISSDAFEEELNEDTKLFNISPRTLQQKFKNTSENTGIFINPHLLRTVFVERCRDAGIEKEYIQAFQGRKPRGVLEANYTVYGPKSLKKQYEKVESKLILDLPSIHT